MIETSMKSEAVFIVECMWVGDLQESEGWQGLSTALLLSRR